ncbi:MAG: FAD-binding protein [Candidatus Stahlbacteria bacterium]|nr:FAD-binding protein [Candidatus Stahlbacteria bacterium]
MISELEKIVGKDKLITHLEGLEVYSHDEAPGLKSMPLAVVKPTTSKEVSEIMIWANKNHIPITARGGGTGLSGGAIPCDRGIVISFEHMNRVKEIDIENLMCVVEPGVIVGDLANEVKKHSLMYPPDPASIDSCTIGGNIAECAGGARTIKYGTTKDYVVGLEAVLPTGEIIRCGGKLVKNVTGYNLINLLIGSEGTLAITTEATLRLLPMSMEKVSLLIPYNSMEEAVHTVQEIFMHSFIPSAIEFIEADAIKAAEEYTGKKFPFIIDIIPAYSLLIEIDGKRKEEVAKDYESIGELALNNGAMDVFIAENRLQQEKLWSARRSISEAMKSKGAIAHEDVVVPRSCLPLLLHKIRELGQKYKYKICCYGHIGDGNVHVNILQADTSIKYNYKDLIKELFSITCELGGMISGEHGIGLTKKPYLSMSLCETQISLMRNIKRCFDPNNILNPGKIF